MEKQIDFARLIKIAKLCDENVEAQVYNALNMINEIRDLVLDAEPYEYPWIVSNLRSDDKCSENNEPLILKEQANMLDGFIVAPKVL